MPGAITLPGNNGVREPPLGVTGICFNTLIFNKIV